MFYFILLFLEIGILFLLSRKISKIFSQFMSINFLSFLFLPGVIIHELSHLLIAAILLVPVGDMEFMPKKGEAGLKLGSIEIAKTDPIRRSIIGFAPVFVGITLVLGLTYFVVGSNLIVQTIELNVLLGVSIIALMFYLLFAISNTMFSSSRDMEGTIEILITLLIIFAGAYILGFRLSLSYLDKIFTKELIELVQKSAIFLLIPIAIDLFILGTIKLLTVLALGLGRRSRIW